MELLSYVLLSFASLIGPILGLSLLGAGPHEPTSWAAFAVCIGVILAVARREARRDLDKIATFATAMGFLWTIVYGAATAVVERPYAFGAVAVLLGALTIACLVRVVRSALWKDPVPNLRSLGWDARDLCETVGVQFAVACTSPERILSIDLQNCVDAPRKVQFSFLAERNMAQPFDASAALAPLEVGRIRIVLPGQFPGGTFSITPRVSGPDGKRVRRWHARAYSPPVSIGFQILAALAGHLAWGGGMSVQIPPATGDAPHSATPVATWVPIWPASQEIVRVTEPLTTSE